MDEIGFEGQTAETKAMEHLDRTSDGTMSFSRAQMCEAEIERDSMAQFGAPQEVNIWNPRSELLGRAAASPGILRGWSMTPLDDRIMVRYASFREGYVCEVCDGSGHTDSVCETCLGLKRYTPKPSRPNEACPDCRIVGSENMTPTSCGKVPCPSCSGSGLAPGVMAIPDASKQDHSYGDILTVGSQVYDLQPGDRVVFSKLAGIYVKGDSNCCLLRRGEIMGLMLKAEK